MRSEWSKILLIRLDAKILVMFNSLCIVDVVKSSKLDTFYCINDKLLIYIYTYIYVYIYI